VAVYASLGTKKLLFVANAGNHYSFEVMTLIVVIMTIMLLVMLVTMMMMMMLVTMTMMMMTIMMYLIFRRFPRRIVSAGWQSTRSLNGP
jgi:hypothetical protein